MVSASLSRMWLIFKFRMMTFVALTTEMPFSVISVLPPTPRIDLFDPTSRRSGSANLPLTYTIFGSSPATAIARASGDVTVVVQPPSPPVVLPRGLSRPYPTRSNSSSLSGQLGQSGHQSGQSRLCGLPGPPGRENATDAKVMRSVRRLINMVQNQTLRCL